MKKSFLRRLFLLSATLLFSYASFSQLESKRNPDKPAKIVKQKKPGARMTDFIGSLEYEFNMIKNPATGKIPEGVFEAEKEQARQIVSSRLSDNGNDLLSSYTFQGPDNLGGRTRTIAYDVRYNGGSNQIILAGGVSGGVYKSIDNGATWVRKSPTGQHFSCTSIAQDPRVGFQDTWYYGVGEAAGNSASGGGGTSFYLGNGVYKSTNNGETWTRLANSNTSALESFSTAADLIQKVIVDPTNGNVYAACAATIIRSVDGGTTWGTVLSGALSSSNNYTDIVVTSTGRFYAGFAGTNSVGADGVWTSATGASASWTRIAGPGGTPAGWNANAAYGRVVLGIAPSSENLVYALYSNSITSNCAGVFAPEADLFRWNNTTSTWIDLSATLPDEAGCLNGNDPFAVQGGYDLVVAVKPDDPTVIFIGGTNIYRSTTSGASWTRIGGYNSPADYALYPNSHPDIHSIVFQPGSPAIMLCGNDGGIQRTTNDLAATVVWTPINNGYRTYQYYYVANDPRSGNAKVIGGAQDNGSTRNIGGTGVNFESVYGGDGVSVGLSGATNFEYVGTQSGFIRRRLATDASGSSTNITPTGETNSGLFVTLFKLDPDNTERLYYANDNALYRTTTASTVTTATWTSMTGIATAVGAANDISALAMTRGTYSAVTASLFMGTSNGKVFRLNDPTGVAAATAPVDITGTINVGYISSISVNPRNDDTVLVTLSNYGITSVYWTGNANSAVPTWTAVEGALTLPSYRSSAIAINGSTGAVEYYVGTSAGLWASAGLPGAVAWAQESSGSIGNAVVVSLDLRPSDNKLLVGTHGYGMWTTTLPSACSIALTSAVGTNIQTRCINTAITNITYSTTGATGATFSGLPTGVTGIWAANVVTISGTPSTTVGSPFNYTVTLTGGGCVGITATGTITVTPNNTIGLTSAVGTDAQTKCINTAITNITYSTTGATGATFSGLPTGVTGNWASNVVTISGSPSTTVGSPFSYTVTLTGGCGSVTATGTITVTPNNTITLTSAGGTNAQTRCINTAITNITYSTTGATGATFSGLPTGVTGNWASNVVTISGSPSTTVGSPFSYTVTLTGGCGTVTATGTITVTPNNTISLTSAVGTNAQTRCINTAITNITYSTTGATGATFSGFPTGVTGNWAANVVTISGSPSTTVGSPFSYTVTLTGGCGTVTATGTITVTPNNTITLTSAGGTNAQTRCINTAITNITYSTTGATGATFSGLPTGVTGNWAANVVTISGSPSTTVGSPFNYTVTLTGGCGTVTATGTITVTPNNTITLTSAVGTNAQTRCINTAITNITYSTTGATGATFSGLPAGVTGNWAANVVTISGSPSTTVGSPFSYTVTLTGGCGTITATGTITVTPNNTITLTSAGGTNVQTRCINSAITNITYATTGATGATFSGLPTGVTGNWAANVVTISGAPSNSLGSPFNYIVTLTGGCGTVTATGTITVTNNNSISLTSAVGTNAQTVNVFTPITNITYFTTGATGATFSGLPAGVTGNWAANVVTISGSPSTTVGSPFNYTVTLTGGCGTVTATGTITVNSISTITVNLKLFLQGYYIGGSTMQPVLNNQNVFLSAPTQADTVTVELHHPTNFTLIDSKKAVLSTAGLVSATFTQPASNYYIAVKHRNTIQTWTNGFIPCSNATPLYNFSSLSTQAYGDNQVQVDPGVWAMFTGDLNQDEFIDGNDFPAFDSDSFNGVNSVYVATDMNGDGFVDGNDFPVFDSNSFNGVSSIHP